MEWELGSGFAFSVAGETPALRGWDQFLRQRGEKPLPQRTL